MQKCKNGGEIKKDGIFVVRFLPSSYLLIFSDIILQRLFIFPTISTTILLTGGIPYFTIKIGAIKNHGNNSFSATNFVVQGENKNPANLHGCRIF